MYIRVEHICILIHIPTFNYDQVISIKAESPEVNAKIKQRFNIAIAIYFFPPDMKHKRYFFVL